MGYIRQEYMGSEYIRSEYMWQARKMIRVRSKAKRKNHMTFIFHVENKESQKVIQKEIQKAIHRMNCLLETKVSYEGIIILEKNDLET